MVSPAIATRRVIATAPVKAPRCLDTVHIINLRTRKKNKPEIDLAQRFHGRGTLGPLTAQEQIGIKRDRPPAVQGLAILHAGLYAQLRSRPTTHHSTPQNIPIMPPSSTIEECTVCCWPSLN